MRQSGIPFLRIPPTAVFGCILADIVTINRSSRTSRPSGTRYDIDFISPPRLGIRCAARRTRLCTDPEEGARWRRNREHFREVDA